MGTKLRQIAIILMLLGVIGVAINTVFSINAVSYITKITDSTTGLTYYKYDLSSYLKTVSLNLGSIPELNLTPPADNWTDFISSLKSIANLIIFVINIILWPLRAGGYIATNIWVLLGVDPNSNPNLWILNTSLWLRDAEIPYIN